MGGKRRGGGQCGRRSGHAEFVGASSHPNQDPGKVVSVRPWHGRSQTPSPGVLSLLSRHVRVLCSSEAAAGIFQAFFRLFFQIFPFKQGTTADRFQSVSEMHSDSWLGDALKSEAKSVAKRCHSAPKSHLSTAAIDSIVWKIDAARSDMQCQCMDWGHGHLWKGYGGGEDREKRYSASLSSKGFVARTQHIEAC